MSTAFSAENNSNNGSSQQQKQPEQARPKRPRSSLACIRCRKKKVKCDFVQPTCGRCAIAGLPCSYATPPRRVDGHAFDQLGNHVEELKERMQKMQSELAMMKNNLHPFASSSTSSSVSAANDDNIIMDGSGHTMPSNLMMEANPAHNMALATSGSEQSVTWKLSLSPSGLRIDTNIASVADLYRILLNGISQLNINNESTTSLFNPDSSPSPSPSSSASGFGGNHNHANNSTIGVTTTGGGIGLGPQSNQNANSKRQTGKANMRKTFGNGNYLDNTTMMDYSSDKGGRLWEVDENEARKILQEKKSTDDVLPKEVLDNLIHTCYHTCFLAYQIVDKDMFMQKYMSDEGLDPLLSNSINAWVSKHGCIYHHANYNIAALSPSNTVTMGEVYFKNARQLLKKCFDISSPNTIHALLNLYMYQLSSERSSLAYLYIGLAIRMAQDLKFHKKEHMSADLKQRETNKRLWWSAYWLDLCAALESNRPTMVDDKDCDLDYPVRLEHEDDETGYRIHFAVYSIKLMRIRKDITKHLPSEQSGQSLLSAISRLENALTNWLNELPNDLHFDDQSGAFQKTGSFRDEACLILNIQYQTTWIMLHKFFLPKQDQTATPVALLSLNICTKAANLITRMLSIYAAHLSWCQFFYAMDGIIASVTIHQVNAFSNEKEVSCLAQRNLIITASVLKKSPLVYMLKVCEIIESIEGFLKKNNLSSDLNDLPPVNEDSINQQSISSVFHPGVFDSQSMSSTQPAKHQPPQQPPQQPQSQQPPSNLSYPGSLSPSVQSQHTLLNSPQSQASSVNMRVPSQLTPMFQPSSLQHTSPVISSPNVPQNNNTNNNNTITAAAGQQMHKTPNAAANPTPLYNDPNLMVGSSDLFMNDPTGLMNFNMGPTGPQAGTDPSVVVGGSGGPPGDMNQMLLRDMGFDLNNHDSRMYTMFDPSGRSNAGSTNTQSSNTNNTTSFPNNSSPYANTFNNNFGSHPGNFANPTVNSTGAPPTSASSSANNPNTASYPNFLSSNDLFGLTSSPQHHHSQQPQHHPHHQTHPSQLSHPQAQAPGQPSYLGNPGPSFDSTGLFGTMNMDPAAMSAFLYNNSMSNFNAYPQAAGAPGAGPTTGDENELLYGPNNGRKRVHRDWEDTV
ncbi:fungal-specific transcription factor domain-containing protein [Choanephora cucurbitarum]|nr:fungal-specific transcription factor domain-containing protein [Choanephora cucurbitarum]